MLQYKYFKKGIKSLIMHNFYGHKDALLVTAVNNSYSKIITPIDLYDALANIWCEYSCAPRMRHLWSQNNPTLGQCSITAFLAQDIFGGKVLGIPRLDGSWHCYNCAQGHTFDLTSEQFGSEILDYSHNPEQKREIHFAKTEKLHRYLYLIEQLKKCTR